MRYGAGGRGLVALVLAVMVKRLRGSIAMRAWVSSVLADGSSKTSRLLGGAEVGVSGRWDYLLEGLKASFSVAGMTKRLQPCQAPQRPTAGLPWQQRPRRWQLQVRPGALCNQLPRTSA
ncbi:hypothetical protein DFH27DRAFT_614193 [Peziza echinospora]|nr:hypothetical protein DFH27DRAFT_614193 [Peziza echinospora]